MASYNMLKEGLDSGNPAAFQTFVEFVEDLLYVGAMDSNFSEFQKYCIAAKSMPTHYTESVDSMAVAVEGNSICLNINPVNVVDYTKNEDQVLFILAHEMKHVLLGHLVKYVDLLKTDVLKEIINLAGDYEVNESIIGELSRRGKSLSCVPKDCIYSKTILPFTDCTEYTLKSRINDMPGTPADAVFHLVEEKVTRVLGYNFSEMLYHCAINRTTFADEIKVVAYGGKSKIFKVKDVSEARDFCRRLNNYLEDKILPILIIPEDSLYTSRDGEDLLGKIKDTFRVLAGGSRASFMEGDATTEVSNISVPSRVNWTNVLKNRVKVISQGIQYSKKRINRRQPYRLDLSGKIRRHKLNIVVAIDESGSISNEEYIYFMSELKSILTSVECSLTFMRFTAEIMEKLEVEGKLDFNKLFNVDKYTRYVGGTCFQPIFDELNNDKRVDLNSTLLVILTDGEAEDTVDFGKVKNGLWVLPRGCTLSCNENSRNVFSVHE